MRHRTAWLAATPLLAGTAALVLGGVAAASGAVALAPTDSPVPALTDAGRAVLGSPLGDLTDLRQLVPVAAGVVLAALTWVVGLGYGVQRMFPRRRRAVPGFVAVLVSTLASWVALGVAAGGDAAVLDVRGALGAVWVTAVVAAMGVLLGAGYLWAADDVPERRRRPVPRPRPAAPVRPRPAGLP